MSYATDLDIPGKIKRQRKVRNIDQDTREQDEITASLLAGEGYTVERKTLRFGDYGWSVRPESWLFQSGYTAVRVERKTLADLRDVVRLKRQLGVALSILAAEAPRNRTLFIVLIEYRFDTDVKRKWSEKAVGNARLSLQLNSHVLVTECEGNVVAGRIDELYRWSQKREHELTVSGGE